MTAKTNKTALKLLSLGAVTLLIFMAATVFLLKTESETNPSFVATRMADGESNVKHFKASQHETVDVNLVLVNHEETDDINRVVLLSAELDVDVGDEINWEINFINPEGGEGEIFYTTTEGVDYYKYVVASDEATPTEVQLTIKHLFMEANDNKDQARYEIHGIDYEADDEPTNERKLADFMKDIVENEDKHNITYLQADEDIPSTSYDKEMELIVGVLSDPFKPRIFADDAFQALAGEVYNLTVTVANQGQQADLITFTAELDGDTKVFWEIEAVNYILGADISLASGAQAIIYLHITPDSDYSKVPGDESYDLILEAVSDTDPEQMHIFPVEIYVPIRYDPQITVSGVDNKVANTDGTATVFAFKLKNAGSITDQINVHALVAGKSRAGPTNDQWTKVIDLISPIEVAAGETVDLSLDITPAMDNEKIPPGNYDVWVNASSANKASAGSSAQVFVEMPNLYNPGGQLITTPLQGSIQVGTEGVYRFKVINGGQIADTFTLDFTITDDEGTVISTIDNLGSWTYRFENYDTGAPLPDNQLTLNSGASQDVRLVITPPAGLSVGDYTLRFAIVSAGPTHESAFVTDVFTLTLPDLWIESTDILIEPDDVTEDEKVTITATIHLSGAVSSEFMVEFQFKSAGGLFAFIEEKVVDFGTESGDDVTKTAMITWTAVVLGANEDNIRVLIDTGGVIAEDEENNNAAEATITVTADDSGDEFPWALVIAGSVLGIGALFLIAYFMGLLPFLLAKEEGLMVDEITIPEGPKVGEETEIKTNAANEGETLEAGDQKILISFFDEFDPIDELNMSEQTFEADTVVELPVVKWKPTQAGERNITVVIEVDGDQVDEKNITVVVGE